MLPVANAKAYNSLWQFKADAWSSLEDAAVELSVAGVGKRSLERRSLLPDPARARVRVYSTQSTHKTLTSLRQGSMIHVTDQDFSQKAEETFHEAYMTHTSTSPNYQILASLDLGRRQAALEGFELVQKQLENAMRLRDAVELRQLGKDRELRDYVWWSAQDTADYADGQLAEAIRQLRAGELAEEYVPSDEDLEWARRELGDPAAAHGVC